MLGIPVYGKESFWVTRTGLVGRVCSLVLRPEEGLSIPLSSGGHHGWWSWLTMTNYKCVWRKMQQQH